MAIDGIKIHCDVMTKIWEMYGDSNESPFLKDLIADCLVPLVDFQPIDDKIVETLAHWERYGSFDDIETSPSPPVETSIDISISMAPNPNVEGSSSSSMIQHLKDEESCNTTLVESSTIVLEDACDSTVWVPCDLV